MRIFQVAAAVFLIAMISAPFVYKSRFGRNLRLRLFYNGDKATMTKDEWRNS